MYKNLREFLNRLERAGELKHIRQVVSSYLEISKLTDRESKSPHGGAALLFENVQNSAFPVATNIFGSPKRICMALGVEHLDDLAERVRAYINMNPPKTLKAALGMLPLAIGLTRFFPRTFKGKTPPCREVVLTGEQIDLSKLPVLHCWPKDAGPFITLPLVFTRSLETGRQNLGMYRMQVFDKTTTGMHWHIHKDGSHYFNEYRRAGKRMPVSVAIGADPATIYAATAPMPRGIDEILLAGFIRQKPVIMTRCLTNDLNVPAEAEFILEGYVDPNELRWEGPFGDHTGYYSLADHYPVFHVTAITHRNNPIYNATLVGRPPMEDCYLAEATERLCLPLLQTVMPEVEDYWLPWEGVFHNSVVVSLDKEYAGHAHKLVSGLWGQGQMSFCKTITVVDRDVSPRDRSTLIDLLLTRLDLSSDIIQTKGVLDVLDHSASAANFGAKIGIDLTTRFPGEPDRHPLPLPAPPQPPLNASAVQRLVAEVRNCRFLFSEKPETNRTVNRLLALSVEKGETQSGREISDKLATTQALTPFNVLIFFDADIDLSDGSLMLWKIFNNVDPSRDMVFYDSRVIINACKKGPADGHVRPWPEDLTFDE
ncbi:MAG: menaquinone biosynthesis decarboxylase [Desulfobacterales bacterium]|nr:menaquinone biosynthesis decarboxylase [Desulfobacterales bacterium]